MRVDPTSLMNDARLPRCLLKTLPSARLARHQRGTEIFLPRPADFDVRAEMQQ
jgi:hypothetical protein